MLFHRADIDDSDQIVLTSPMPEFVFDPSEQPPYDLSVWAVLYLARGEGRCRISADVVLPGGDEIADVGVDSFDWPARRLTYLFVAPIEISINHRTNGHFGLRFSCNGVALDFSLRLPVEFEKRP